MLINSYFYFMRVLLVEDDSNLALYIRQGLKSENYVIDHISDAHRALLKAQNTNYGLIILDVLLPDRNGIDLCQDLRKLKGDTPIIVLTTVADMETKLRAFDAGADDYITKPFSFMEFLARIKAVVRRNIGKEHGENSIQVGDLIINPREHVVTRSGKPIHLRNKEFQLLTFLAKNKGKVFSRAAILEQVWENHLNLLNTTVDVHIRWLREKMDEGFETQLIHTVHGVGYKVDDVKVGGTLLKKNVFVPTSQKKKLVHAH